MNRHAHINLLPFAPGHEWRTLCREYAEQAIPCILRWQERHLCPPDEVEMLAWLKGFTTMLGHLGRKAIEERDHA